MASDHWVRQRRICSGSAVAVPEAKCLGAPTMNVTIAQIKSLLDALPANAIGKKRPIVAHIIAEWADTDLLEHLQRPSARDRNNQAKRLKRLARHAAALASELTAISPGSRFKIARALVRSEQVFDPDVSDQARELSAMPEHLNNIQKAAVAAMRPIGTETLRGKTVVAYLILQDLAAIFEYATGQTASRRVRGKDHAESGRDYGPFYDFAREAWRTIFRSDRALRGALKHWASARRKYKEASPCVVNIAMAHPQWRIYPNRRT